ncbi:hypothetical protein ACQCN2_02770 [Brevibacillus ginsengisoli]
MLTKSKFVEGLVMFLNYFGGRGTAKDVFIDNGVTDVYSVYVGNTQFGGG